MQTICLKASLLQWSQVQFTWLWEYVKREPIWDCVMTRDATIIDFVGTIIVWGIITVSRLLRLLCIYSFHNIKSHKHSLDIKVLFISAVWNRNNTVTNNTAQNNTKEKKIPSLLLELKKLTSAL